LQWNNWVQIIKKDKNPSNQSGSNTCHCFIPPHILSPRGLSQTRLVCACDARAWLGKRQRSTVPSGQTFNLFKPFITSLLFSHFQQPTPMVSTYWKWLSISHCRWSKGRGESSVWLGVAIVTLYFSPISFFKLFSDWYFGRISNHFYSISKFRLL